MIENLEIRESSPHDVPAIEKLYPEAFPDEDLLPLVRVLLSEEQSVTSLVRLVDSAVAGHVIFTECRIEGTSGKVALLAPLAVVPNCQGQGVGSAIVRAGLQRLQDAGVINVFVLGDPDYYGRFGFQPDDRVEPPYPLPEEWRGAWQSLSLDSEGQRPLGKLIVPQPWRRRELWAP